MTPKRQSGIYVALALALLWFAHSAQVWLDSFAADAPPPVRTTASATDCSR